MCDKASKKYSCVEERSDGQVGMRGRNDRQRNTERSARALQWFANS